MAEKMFAPEEFTPEELKKMIGQAREQEIKEAVRAGYQDYELNKDGEPIKEEKDPEFESLAIKGQKYKKDFTPLEGDSNRKIKPKSVKKNMGWLRDWEDEREKQQNNIIKKPI